MKLEVGKKYKNKEGYILSVVRLNFYKENNRNLSVVICENLDNDPVAYPTDGEQMFMCHYTASDIIECIGSCELPIFKKVKNRKGQDIDYLTNYKSSNGFHLGIIHIGEDVDAIRYYSETGEIECSMYRGCEYEESISIEQFK